MLCTKGSHISATFKKFKSRSCKISDHPYRVFIAPQGSEFISMPSGNKCVPVALETASVFSGQRKMARQTYGGAEELRRSFSLESRLTFQQNLKM